MRKSLKKICFISILAFCIFISSFLPITVHGNENQEQNIDEIFMETFDFNEEG